MEKTLEIHLAEQREQIAQRIESIKSYEIEVGSGGSELFIVKWLAAAVARSTK